MSACIFCEFARNDSEVKAQIVYADESSIAFLDIHPVFLGHTLIVPRQHVETLSDLPAVEVGPFFQNVQKIANAVETAMEAHGTFVALNNRVSQSVAHLHVHIVPRRRKDGLRGFFWPRQRYADDNARDEIAHRIAAACKT